MAKNHHYPEGVRRDHRRRQCRPAAETHVIRISDITATEPTRTQVLVTETGRRVWLPRTHADFGPGRVVIPGWLFKQLKPYLVP